MVFDWQAYPYLKRFHVFHSSIPIGRLDYNGDLGDLYTFRYCCGFNHINNLGGIDEILEFPDRTRKYQSEQLFEFFKNRIMSSDRPEINDHIRRLGLDPESTSPLSILSRNGGRRATDRFRVYPEMDYSPGVGYELVTFTNIVPQDAEYFQEIESNLQKGTFLKSEVFDDDFGFNVTLDGNNMGYLPLELFRDFSIHESAEILQINLAPAPSSMRVLVRASFQCDRSQDIYKEDDFMLIEKKLESLKRA